MLAGSLPFPFRRKIRFANDGAQGETRTLTGNVTLTFQDEDVLIFDPGGANRDVSLPAEEGSAGAFFWIKNSADAAENLVVKDDTPATVSTLNQGEWGFFYCDGSAWQQVAGSNVLGISIAADTISEFTAAAGVTIDGALLKDGGAVFADGASIEVDTVNEATAAAGVTVDGVLIKDTTIDVNGTADAIILDADADTHISAPNDDQIDFAISGADDFTMTANRFNVLSGSAVATLGSGTVAGQVVEECGATSTEGWQRVIFEDTISPAAVETAVLTIPAGSVVDGVWANVESALTGGSTTVTWSLGITADPDQYGTATSDGYTTAADALTQNSKWSVLAPVTPLTGAGDEIGLFNPAAVNMVLTGCATGGAAAGDTALTVGSVRIRVEYRTVLPMDNVV